METKKEGKGKGRLPKRINRVETDRGRGKSCRKLTERILEKDLIYQEMRDEPGIEAFVK